MNNSETAFYFSSYENDHDGILRYFTPKIEVPSCGQATIAAIYAKAIEEKLPSCVLRIKTNIGILPIEVIKKEDDYIISMTQGRIEISKPLSTGDRDELLAALKITANDLNQDCPVQIASTGHSKVMIGIQSRKLLNDIEPDNNRLIILSKKI
ncbi:MAG: PhzF family phenazine biosynthesis isomerase, partial [Spirochaeta sp.]|nr:PhzF family phenazine biosynthesis isomerase [Spirochaeta sp.]